MALIELAIAEAVASGAVRFGMKKAEERVNVRTSLMDWRLDKDSPGVDNVLRSMAGSPETNRERFISGAVIKVARAIVNRRPPSISWMAS